MRLNLHLSIFALLAYASAVIAAPPNVLLIIADDFRPDAGYYGVRPAPTPNLDRLASTALRFDRAYCQFPLCGPSRASFLTGRLPGTTGVLNHDHSFRRDHADWITLPQHFRQHGYTTAATGKIEHGGMEDAASWTERVAVKVPKAHRLPEPKLPEGKKLDEYAKDAILSDRVVVLPGDGEGHADYHVASAAVSLLEKHRAGPFFIAVGFQKPHSPPTAPARFFDAIAAEDIVLPPDFQPRPKVPAGFPEESLPARNGDLFMDREATPQAAREMIRAYRASAAWMDWNAGRVLTALERLGLAENTIVIFFSDHGYHLGEKGKWSKHGSLFEVALRVPLLIRVPGITQPGSTPRTVQLMDLYPTLAALCGLPAPAEVQGHDFSPLLSDPQAAWPHPALSQVKRNGHLSLSVRTERWHFIQHQSGSLLFDSQNDPHEMTNLATTPEHAATMEEMRRLLPPTAP